MAMLFVVLRPFLKVIDSNSSGLVTESTSFDGELNFLEVTVIDIDHNFPVELFFLAKFWREF